MSGEFDTGTPHNETAIPEAIRVIIAEEVAEDIAIPLAMGDEETAAFLRDVMQDAREGTFSFLSWINKTTNPQRVLYPASGFDKIPKLAFGEDKVVHTSLENNRDKDEQRYYDKLGPGLKVIADNAALPFADDTFQAICLLDSQEEIIGEDLEKYTRILTPGGLIILSKNNVLNPEDNRVEAYAQETSLEQVSVPEHFQLQGAAQVEFSLFRKVK